MNIPGHRLGSFITVGELACFFTITRKMVVVGVKFYNVLLRNNRTNEVNGVIVVFLILHSVSHDRFE